MQIKDYVTLFFGLAAVLIALLSYLHTRSNALQAQQKVDDERYETLAKEVAILKASSLNCLTCRSLEPRTVALEQTAIGMRRDIDTINVSILHLSDKVDAKFEAVNEKINDVKLMTADIHRTIGAWKEAATPGVQH